MPRPARRPSPAACNLPDVGDAPVPGPTEQRELARRARAGDWDARERLILGNIRLVLVLARRRWRAGRSAAGDLTVGDLVGEGVLGLIRAIEVYDPGRGVPFGHYAATWVRNRQGGAAWRARTIAPPPHRRDRRGDPVAVPDVGPLPEDVMASAPDASGPGDDSGRLRAALEALPDRERAVVRLRFGLDGEAALSQAEVGRRIDRSKQRAVQLERAALARLRAALGAAEGDDG